MVASGLIGSEAYRQTVGTYAGKDADVLANKWLNRTGVRERIAELKEANSRKATWTAGHARVGPLSREQKIEFPVQIHQYLGCQGRSGFAARAIRGTRRWQACENQNPRQDRGGQGTD